MIKKTTFALLIFAITIYSNESIRIKAGVGVGNGYGMAGGTLELEVAKTSILVGVGTFGVEGLSWDFGLRYYLRNADKKIRPWLILSYAPTHTIKYEQQLFNIKNEEIIFGYNLLAGFDHDFGSLNGFVMTYGIGLAIPGDYPQQVKDDYNMFGQELQELDKTAAFALGIKYQFKL